MPLRSVDVAQHLGVKKPSVCNAVSILEQGGFLVKDEDHFLHLTEKGRGAQRLSGCLHPQGDRKSVV